MNNTDKENRDAWISLEKVNELIERLRMFGNSFTLETIDKFLKDNERPSLDYDTFIEVLQSKLKAQQGLIDTIRQSIEQMCIDDCGINLSVCDRGTLEEIIRTTDKRARLLLAKLEEK